MNSATPMDTGTAMIIASRPVINVWNSSAAMPNCTGLSSGSHCSKVKKSAVLARSAGTDRTTRKAAIAAMISRTVAPAATLSERKTRSPGRTAAPLISPATGGSPPIDRLVAVPTVGPTGSLVSRSPGEPSGSLTAAPSCCVLAPVRPAAPGGRKAHRPVVLRRSGRAQRVDRRADPAGQVGRQRRVAELRQLGLAGVAGRVGQERLDELRLAGRQTLGAGDLVRGEDGRVRAGVLEPVVDLQHDVLVVTADLGGRDRLAHGVRVRLHRAGADVELGRGQAVLGRVRTVD